MLRAVDVANFFIDLSTCSSQWLMTNKMVNKLVYFAQGWSLVRLGKQLFNEDVLAWEYGPVIQSVYDAFKSYGKNKIDKFSGEYSPKCFSNKEMELLIDVACHYGQYTESRLVEITHEKGAPWSQFYVKNANNVIPTESIRKYFSELSSLPSFRLKISDDDLIGRRDEDGYLVLPKEWDDGEY